VIEFNPALAAPYGSEVGDGFSEAVLEMLGRFSEDLTALQRAIRWGEGEKLEDWFTRTRAVRRSIIDAKQA